MSERIQSASKVPWPQWMSLIWATRSGSSASELSTAGAEAEARSRTIVRAVVTGSVSHTLVRALRAVPAFDGLDETTLCEIVGASSNLVWTAGSTIFEPGEPAEALYIVLSGSVRIVDETEHDVAQLGAGDFFGELSLLLRTTHSKRAEATEDSELMVLPKEPFDALLAEDPHLAQAVRGAMETRLRSVDAR
jgi:signal-transduction protein with cAMP-binding, CBS, and nucleotidyltransferase domain